MIVIFLLQDPGLLGHHFGAVGLLGLDQAEVDQRLLLGLVRVADQQGAWLEAVAYQALAVVQLIETQACHVGPGVDQLRTAVRPLQVAGEAPVVAFAPFWRGVGHERDGVHRRGRLGLQDII